MPASQISQTHRAHTEVRNQVTEVARHPHESQHLLHAARPLVGRDRSHVVVRRPDTPLRDHVRQKRDLRLCEAALLGVQADPAPLEPLEHLPQNSDMLL